MRAASPALQEWWPDGEGYDSDGDVNHDGESPRSWKGVTWSDDRVQELDLGGSKLEVLPPQTGQLQALTKLDLTGCPLVALPPELRQLQALKQIDFEERRVISKSGLALEFASEDLKGDTEMVRIAVEQNGLALEFASEDLKGDMETVHIAATQNDQALDFASIKKLEQYWELVKDMDKDDRDVAKDSEHFLMNREEQNRSRPYRYPDD